MLVHGGIYDAHGTSRCSDVRWPLPCAKANSVITVTDSFKFCRGLRGEIEPTGRKPFNSQRVQSSDPATTIP